MIYDYNDSEDKIFINDNTKSEFNRNSDPVTSKNEQVLPVKKGKTGLSAFKQLIVVNKLKKGMETNQNALTTAREVLTQDRDEGSPKGYKTPLDVIVDKMIYRNGIEKKPKIMDTTRFLDIVIPFIGLVTTIPKKVRKKATDLFNDRSDLFAEHLEDPDSTYNIVSDIVDQVISETLDNEEMDELNGMLSLAREVEVSGKAGNFKF